ncbi:MAG: hypothetical protein U0804_06345 [Gemmataceae bacterium]
MNARERTLAAALIGMIVLAVGGAAAWLFVLVPYSQKTQAADRVAAEVEKLEGDLKAARREAPRLAEARKRSLPADASLAKREYAEMLGRVLQKAGVAPGYRITEKSPDPAGTPVLPGAGKKLAYQKVCYEVSFERADMWNVKDVLEGYYRLNVLQQITHLDIKVDPTPTPAGKAKVAGDRHDLIVKLGTEAIILDNAENRRTFLPVPTAFAGVGGWLGYNGVALSPEVGRGITPTQLAPVLSLKNRDYSLLVLKDPFHGPLPPPPPMSLGRIADVAVKVGDKLDPIRVPVVADADYVGKVSLTATVEGGPFKGTEVKVDEARKTVQLAPKAGETGTGTVTVVAKAANGQKAERSFKVRVDEPPPEKEPTPVAAKEDISADIVLIGVSIRSDGTATAFVRDKYNPLTYELEASARRVKVLQYEHLGQRKKQNKAYRPDAENGFDIDDDGNTGTKRNFKVVSVDDGGLVVEDLKANEAPKAADPKAAKGGPPVKGVPMLVKAPPAVKAPPSPADGLAGAVGFASVVRPKATGPVLYRWAPGQSLAKLTPLSAAEAKRVLDRSAATGPVGAAAVSAPSSDDPIPAPKGN